MVDKLECDLQCKFYDEFGCTDLKTPRVGNMEKIRKERLQFSDSFSEAWIKYNMEKSHYDDFFKNLDTYIVENQIFKKD